MSFLKLKKLNVRHFVCILFLSFTVFWLFAFCRFSITRFFESLRDFGIHFVYAIFYKEPWCPRPTFNDPSSVDLNVIFPNNFETFTARFKLFFNYFFDKTHIKLYWIWMTPKIQFFSRLLLISFIPIFLAFILKKYVIKPKITLKHSVSVPLRLYLKLEKKVFIPLKKLMIDIYGFFLRHKIYFYTFVFVFLLGSNILSFIFTFFSWYFYFCGSLDWQSLFLYLYKFFFDFVILLKTLPLPLWLFIFVIAFDKITRYFAVKRLIRQENRNEDFVRSLGLVVFVIGLMRAGKTKLISSMSKTQARAFRKDVLGIMLEVHSHFPHFPYPVFIKFLRKLIDERKIRGLGFCDAYVRILKRKYEESGEDPEYLFGYDGKRFGLTYDNGNVVISLFKDLSDFAQAYLIYSEPTLMFGNYSMREDDINKGVGNLEEWDMDIFRRPSFNGEGAYSHVLDYDSFRPGKKMKPENKAFGSIEYGVGSIAEIDKERENTVELEEVKRNSKECNQKNDLFNLHLKMMGHAGSVHFKTLIKLFTDSQRKSSWGADGSELAELVKMVDTSELHLSLRFSFFRWILYDKLKDLHDSKVYDRWVLRSDSYLRSYLFDKFITWYLRYFERIINTFGYVKQTLTREEVSGNDEQTAHTWYQANKKVHSGLYSTASFSSYYRKYNKIANVAFRDLPRYKDSMPDFYELEQLSNSHFIKKINKDQYEELD